MGAAGNNYWGLRGNAELREERRNIQAAALRQWTIICGGIEFNIS